MSLFVRRTTYGVLNVHFGYSQDRKQTCVLRPVILSFRVKNNQKGGTSAQEPTEKNMTLDAVNFRHSQARKQTWLHDDDLWVGDLFDDAILVQDWRKENMRCCRRRFWIFAGRKIDIAHHVSLLAFVPNIFQWQRYLSRSRDIWAEAEIEMIPLPLILTSIKQRDGHGQRGWKFLNSSKGKKWVHILEQMGARKMIFEQRQIRQTWIEVHCFWRLQERKTDMLFRMNVLNCSKVEK